MQWNPFSSINKTLLIKFLVIFIIYIAIGFIFGWIYYSVYLDKPENFTFNSDIVQSQSALKTNEINEFKEIQNRKITNLTAKLAETEKLKAELNSNKKPIVLPRNIGANEPRAFLTTQDRVYLFERITIKVPRHSVDNFITLTISDINGKVLAQSRLTEYQLSFGLDLKDDINHYLEITQVVIDSINKEIEESRNRIESSFTSSPIWTYWDFLYFSMITLSTVGYGDILPNSTLVRMIVVTELIFGSLLLIVFINVIAETKAKQLNRNIKESLTESSDMWINPS